MTVAIMVPPGTKSSNAGGRDCAGAFFKGLMVEDLKAPVSYVGRLCPHSSPISDLRTVV